MKKTVIFILAAGCLALGYASGIFAGTTVPDMIKMDNPVYEKHKEGIVVFSHTKHAVDYAKAYPDLCYKLADEYCFSSGCGVCHHDENRKPLSNLKTGDDVQSCLTCHKKPGETPGKMKKEWRKKKIKRAERKKLQLQWHAEAIHANCQGCHRAFKKKTKKKTAPTTCKKCHVKKK